MATVSRQVRPVELENDLAYNCYRVSQLARDELCEGLRELDEHLTPEQWHLMQCLAEAPAGLTPSELAQVGLRDKTTISRMLDVMGHHGLIERTRRPGDARSYFVQLTKKSRAILQQAHATRMPGAAHTFSALSNAEHELLLALLQKSRRGIGDL